MRFLDHTSVWDWCRAHGYALMEDGPSIVPRLADDPALVHQHRINHDAVGRGERAGHLAARVLTALGPWQECLGWATDWDVWEQVEDWPRYYAWRAGYAERRSLASAPGHLFEATDHDALAWLLRHVLECGWDVHLLPVHDYRATGVRIRTSHDEWIAVSSARPLEFPAHAG